MMIYTVRSDKVKQVMLTKSIEAGLTLKAIRKNKRFTTSELAILTQTARQTINRIENGLFSPKDYLKAQIALALGVNIEDIWPWPTNEEILTSLKEVA